MRRKQNRKGFTMVEMIIVVAVIVILLGVIGVAVPRYQRSMHQLEMDGHAKELFVAAQYHLTTAKNQGYLGLDAQSGKRDGSNPLGTQLSKDTAKALYGGEYEDIYYFTVTGGSGFGSNSLLDVMLPFGSVDETLRTGGNYVICYQRSTGQVLDVFYDNADGTRFGASFSDITTDAKYKELWQTYHGPENKDNRAKYSDSRNKIIGWYGDGEALMLPAEAEQPNAPELRVYNGEQLFALIYPNNDTITGLNTLNITDPYTLKLEITGTESGKTVTITIGSSESRVSWLPYSGEETALQGKYCFYIILDDITKSDQHFAQLSTDLIPGEDIRLVAKLTKTDGEGILELKSETYRTNSLFAYNKDDDSSTVPNVAKIGYIRHLENLDVNVSGFNFVSAKYQNSNKVAASQISDLSWAWYASNDLSIYGTSAKLTDKSFYPVTPTYTLAYDGKGDRADTGHTISDVVVTTNHSGAGLFGTLGNGCSVENLALIDFKVEAPENVNAGALAGNLIDSTVENVVAYHGSSAGKEANKITASGTADAGGLIGSATGTAISSSYSGGHTAAGTAKYSDTNYNINGVTAGGLVGSAGADTTISYSYSTCSVSGTTAGGLVGSFAGDTVTNCYATGLIPEQTTGTTRGAFVGSVTAGTVSGQYFMIVNEIKTESSFEYMNACGSVATGATATVAAFDETAATYNSFVGDPSTWRPSAAYDTLLFKYYHYDRSGSTDGVYSLGGIVGHFDSDVTTTDFVATHYGDWPAPELWVFNDKS